MNEKLRKIVNHYGIKQQLKYFQSEIFELNEAILNRTNSSPFEDELDNVIKVYLTMLGEKHTDRKREHIKEEIADVMVMLKQFQLYYNIPTNDIRDIMEQKVNRQLERITKEK